MTTDLTPEQVDDLLSLGDQFLADWSLEPRGERVDNRYAERQAQWDVMRPVFASSPDMLDELKAGIETAQDVIETWTQGDLAAAVNALEEWMKAAQGLVAKVQPTTQGE